jgi:hypothetical protein
MTKVQRRITACAFYTPQPPTQKYIYVIYISYRPMYKGKQTWCQKKVLLLTVAETSCMKGKSMLRILHNEYIQQHYYFQLAVTWQRSV